MQYTLVTALNCIASIIVVSAVGTFAVLGWASTDLSVHRREGELGPADPALDVGTTGLLGELKQEAAPAESQPTSAQRSRSAWYARG